MSEIHLLSQSTIDQIAAGEVVDRPLNVVKELTENAIDAGAGAITVEIKDGGISFIRVTDNGSGIEKGQLKKAFLRHATSKITDINDLCKLNSLGFRGEALSSIAAVSMIEVITKTSDELTGTHYQISGGKEETIEEIGAPGGTTFLVRNLFYNTPARKKFLKQPQTEGGYVAEMMEHLALSHPDIAIKFVNQGQVKFHTSGNGDLKEVIYRIYGKDVSDALIPFSAQGNDFTVKGFLGSPSCCRSNRNFETCFINERYVNSETINKSIEEGYRSFLMQHKFPFYVLHFVMNPESIDVNVHPSKMEIRINHAAELYQQLSVSVYNKLQEQELIPEVVLTEPTETPSSQSQKIPEPFELRRSTLEERPTEYYADEASGNTVVHKEGSNEPKVQDFLQKIALNKVIGAEKNDFHSKNEGIHANIIKNSEHILVEKPAQINLFEDKFLTMDAKEEYRILGQIFDTYWLIAFHDKLYIMDQHAAHEKVKYERLVKQYENNEIHSQMLNPPVIISVTGNEEAILNDYMEYFITLGFELEGFGSGSYALRSIPVDLFGCNEKEFFTDILDELAENPYKNSSDDVMKKLASMACKAAVKGNNSLSTNEAEALIDELLSLENPYNCPHGRPTIISMSQYEIEKKFKRII